MLSTLWRAIQMGEISSSGSSSNSSNSSNNGSNSNSGSSNSGYNLLVWLFSIVECNVVSRIGSWNR